MSVCPDLSVGLRSNGAQPKNIRTAVHVAPDGFCMLSHAFAEPYSRQQAACQPDLGLVNECTESCVHNNCLDQQALDYNANVISSVPSMYACQVQVSWCIAQHTPLGMEQSHSTSSACPICTACKLPVPARSSKCNVTLLCSTLYSVTTTWIMPGG